MKSEYKRWPLILAILLITGVVSAAEAQSRQSLPNIGYCFPAGAQRGTAVTITVSGQYLKTVTGAHLSGAGVQLKFLGYDRPLTQREVLLLRDRLDQARKKLTGEDTTPITKPNAAAGTPSSPSKTSASDPKPTASTAASDPKPQGQKTPVAAPTTKPSNKLRINPRRLPELMELAKEAGITDEEMRKLLEYQKRQSNRRNQLNPQIEEKVTLQLTIDPNAAPGPRDLRLVFPAGVTNPIRFCIGQYVERQETEPNDQLPDPCINGRLPAVINGQILPADVDHFTFTARKGMRLVAVLEGRELIPYLADTVPGWFQPTIAILDKKGHELAFADHFQFHQDPQLCCVIPDDGEYVLEVRDALYRGREDFVYRVTLGELPVVTGLFPLGAKSGAETAVSLLGWNLPSKQARMMSAEQEPAALKSGGSFSNSLYFTSETLPECRELGHHATPGKAQKLALPIIVNGQIRHSGETDVYSFQGRAGAEFVADVMARRLGSPIDSVIRLTDARGRLIAENDDFEDKGVGLQTHNADSHLEVRLPASGTYYLSLRDAQNQGGPEYGYRLRLGAPRPDFALRIVPSSLSVRADGTAQITVNALRYEGFRGEIKLELLNAPAGYRLNGARIPADHDSVTLTLSTLTAEQDGPVALQMIGRASVGGKELLHRAVPTEDRMQAFAYHHLVPADEWLVTVAGKAPQWTTMAPKDPAPVRIPAGGIAAVHLEGRGALALLRFNLSIIEPVPGITIQSVTSETGGIQIVIKADAAKVKPGTQGNLLLNAASTAIPPPTKKRTTAAAVNRAAAARGRPTQYLLPAIPFEIVTGK